MFGVDMVTPAARWGRAYFALQAIAGCAWWTAVFVSPAVRGATLGSDAARTYLVSDQRIGQ